eukprot:TRINITY_DN16222_c0_g1_i2.p1 TRINITY_DN16222_c0_g1~~TRINITY_DN16222_c0_g1_i2.p1  ORF type:complete len:303 (+),score=51.81 TRINITY_DN16222_c0_g1_i2:53-910(+)
MTCRLVASLLLATEAYSLQYYSEEIKLDSVFREHSFAAPFLTDWWQGGIENWDLKGDAVLTQDVVKLTGHIPHQVGAFVNTVPVKAKHWQLVVEFRIHSRSNPGADGFAIWYTKEGATAGDLWGQDPEFTGMGLIIDTFDNDARRDNPAITLILRREGDRPPKWDVQRDLSSTGRFRCLHEIRNSPEGKNAKIRIVNRYNRVEVFVKPHNTREFFCGELRSESLPVDYFFSLSAKTGTLADNHDIISFQVSQAPDLAEDNEHKYVHDPKQAQVDKEKHSRGESEG